MLKKINLNKKNILKLIFPIFILILSIYLVYLSFNYSIYSIRAVSNEEISKIEDPCVIKQLKNKVIENEKHEYNKPVLGDDLNYIKRYCRVIEVNEKESEPNKKILENQKEILNNK